MYRGDLLEGSYDEWLLEERERLRQRYLEALERLSVLLEARGHHAQAVPYAEQLMRNDPLREAAYRLLMRLHNAAGNRARALRVYHACATTLERELGIEPSGATRAAYEALLPPQRTPGPGEPPAEGVGGPAFVGRAAERAQLTALWRAAENGRAQFVLVTGEAGIGKSRLLQEFRSWCVHRGSVTAEARSYQAEGTFAYGPVAAWLRSEAFKPRLEQLDRMSLTELARLLPELLSELPDLVHPEPLPENDQRQRLFDALAGALLAPEGPALLVADDLQWCDREALQFLHYLLRVEPGAHLMVAATSRQEDVDQGHPLGDLISGLQTMDRFTEIQLGRLTREETAALAEGFAGHPFEQRDADHLYDETEGNPLFVIEALRAGWKSGSVEKGWISPKVQAVIEARLGQLSASTYALVGLAATVGRSFTSDVLKHASETDEETLVRGLDELWRRRLIRDQGTDAYDFSHDKIREVAYLAQSPARRRRNHLRVARALERFHAHDPGPVSGQLAAHYESAGVADEAILWYGRAAEAAQQLHANGEAVRLRGRALDLLRTLPETPERDARELEMLTAFPAPLLAVEGYASRRLDEVHRRASKLVHSLGVDPVPPLLRSLALASLSADDFEAARRAGEQLQARGEHDDLLLVEAEYVLGIAAFWGSELDAARRHFEATVERYRPEHRRAHLLWYAQDPKVVCLSRLGNTLWFLGCPESATRTRDAARALAEQIGHPYSRSIAIAFAAMLALEMREPDHLRVCVAALQAERPDRQARQIQILHAAFEGYLDVLGRRTKVGFARIARALDDSRAETPAPGHYGMVMRVLLESCGAAGDARAGLAATEQALEMRGIRLWDAEVHRLRGEYLAALGASSEDIESELRSALEVARKQGARMLELRAAASLLRCRLERSEVQGTSEARGYLAAIVHALPEGRNSPEVREAAALLIPERTPQEPRKDNP